MLAAGTQLAGYRIEGFLGRGGMGVVYEATQLSLERAVALKVLGPEVAGDPVLAERFRREALLQATIDHPHVVTVYEAGVAEEGPFIAMRLIRGTTLKAAIRDGLRPEAAVRLLVPIADALDAAHGAGLVHRDVKPQNILIGPRDFPLLADFGIVLGPQSPALTQTGRFLGTPDYAAPEQVMGESATPASDVYSLAVVLYESLTSVVPFQAPTPAAALYARLKEAPPPPSARRPELPPAVDEVLARGLARDPRERPHSATELMRQAEHALAAPTRRGSRAATVPPRRRRPGRAFVRRGLAVAGAIVVAGLAAALITLDHGAGKGAVPTPTPTVIPERSGGIAITGMAPGTTLGEFLRRKRRLGLKLPAGAGPPRAARGTIVEFEVRARGFAGQRLRIRWSLYTADGSRQLDTNLLSPVRIDALTDRAADFTWIQDPLRSRRCRIALELYDPAGTLLDTDRSAPFRT